MSKATIQAVADGLKKAYPRDESNVAQWRATVDHVYKELYKLSYVDELYFYRACGYDI